MKLGILADIHEDTRRLRLALTACRQAGADAFVTLGDIFETGRGFAETVDLLADAGTVGVWGNHDMGLCVDVGPDTVAGYPPAALDFMAGLRTRLDLAGCLFAHGLPHWDPLDPAEYYTGARLDDTDARRDCFAAFAHPVCFVGHFHLWRLTTSAGHSPWDGTAAIHLRPDERYVVTIHAVCAGYCAVYDTDRCELTPLTLD